MIEFISRNPSARPARVVLFDFDGTLSVIRAGWTDIMAPILMEALLETRSGETEAEIRDLALDLIGRTTGKDTIFQMSELAAHVSERGGIPREPEYYKRIYLDGLAKQTVPRIAALESGDAAPEDYLVPGARALLEALRDRGLTLYLASGTDHASVVKEAKLLEIDSYFAGIYGALEDTNHFSKGILINRIVDSGEFRGEEFLGFGDGVVEIEEVKKVGGITVGVPTDEPECLAIDERKRSRLINAGADFIIPNFLELDELLDTLFEPTHAVKV